MEGKEGGRVREKWRGKKKEDMEGKIGGKKGRREEEDGERKRGERDEGEIK